MSGPSSQWYSEDDQRVVHALDLLQESGRGALSSLLRRILTIVSPPASKRRVSATTCSQKSGQQVFLFIRNCVIYIPTSHPSNHRLPHSISCPSDHFYPRPNVASQRPPAPKERPTGPPLIYPTSYPTTVCNRPPCRILLTTGTLF